MASEHKIDAKLIDELLRDQDPEKVLSSEGLLGELKKALAERMLDAEMDVHLEGEAEQATGNHRNGRSPKRVLTESGSLPLTIPRDRHGRFEPKLIEKYKRRFPGFDEKIVALYARGMTTRDIQAHIRERYGLEISPDRVSALPDAVHDEVGAWQARSLEPVYAIVFFHALLVHTHKHRDNRWWFNRKSTSTCIEVHPGFHPCQLKHAPNAGALADVSTGVCAGLSLCFPSPDGAVPCRVPWLSRS